MGVPRLVRSVGEIYAEGPPVPIPNTEVKLCRAENTQLATAREDRYAPTQSGKPTRFPVLHIFIQFRLVLFIGDPKEPYDLCKHL